MNRTVARHRALGAIKGGKVYRLTNLAMWFIEMHAANLERTVGEHVRGGHARVLDEARPYSGQARLGPGRPVRLTPEGERLLELWDSEYGTTR